MPGQHGRLDRFEVLEHGVVVEMRGHHHQSLLRGFVQQEAHDHGVIDGLELRDQLLKLCRVCQIIIGLKVTSLLHNSLYIKIATVRSMRK